MNEFFAAVPAGMTAYSAAEQAASGAITAAASADAAATFNAVALAVGPIGAVYLTAYGPAQAHNLAGAMLCGAVHAGVSGGTDACKSTFVAVDNA